ncbi:E3 ubiquitin ligase BIG BROTHER-related-like isoform X2 [Tripterygium wilfordii]|nr:E3 ubiquitin ligase BIG BROTHER-related-like isoform X2 [Tripterygium wilfordii]XP_038695665.1 E3 ubiquitin ligase BIG BROTHER-related-like isoform X2 [Tripterygium wilfordii]
MAMALQEQEREALTALPHIETDSDDEEESEEYSSGEEEDYDSNDYEFFQSSRELEAAELEFLEEEGSNNDDDDEEMEEDDVDVDELTYEDLIALGEFIGEEKRGMSANEIPTCLRQFQCLSVDQNNRVDVVDRCVVCQVEFEEGEALVGLPCEHPFHSDCITKWLQIKKVCPICGTEVSSPKTATSRN